MDMTQFTGSNYLGSDEVPPTGLFWTIKAVQEEMVGKNDNDPGDRKAVLYFNEYGKGMALNKTNVQTCLDRFGPDSNAWLGQTVGIRVEPVMFGGKQTRGLRIHFEGLPGSQPAAVPQQQVAPVAQPQTYQTAQQPQPQVVGQAVPQQPAAAAQPVQPQQPQQVAPAQPAQVQQPQQVAPVGQPVPPAGQPQPQQAADLGTLNPGETPF